jgi:2-dehydro-3-deoxygluconokinase
MKIPANRRLEILAIGEPLTEFTAEDTGSLGEVRHFRRGFGGDSSNLVVAASRQGARCGYLTRIGDDAFGHSFLEFWQHEGIDTSNVMCIAGATTGVYFVARTAQGERQFTYYRRDSAASTMTPGDVSREAVGEARIIHASGIGQAISTHAKACIASAFSVAREAGCIVSYDANVRPNLAALQALRDTFEQTVAQVDILFLSEHDSGLLYPDQAPLAVAESLARRGPGSRHRHARRRRMHS